MTKEDMKQISDLMDEKFIASEGRVRAETDSHNDTLLLYLVK